MKKPFYFLAVLLLSYGCESEAQKKQKAQDVVNALISNINLDNYKSIIEYYPSFKEIKGKYWKYNSIQLTSTMIKQDGVIEVFAKSDNNNKLLFVLKEINGNYKIIKSKGLSSYFNSNIYKYSKKIGCVGTNEFDIDIARICNGNENEFKAIVDMIKSKIQLLTVLENHTVKKEWSYVSGDVTIKNHSRFTIPGHSYEVNINFLNSKNEILFNYKDLNNVQSLPFHSNKTMHVFKDVSKGYRKIGIDLRILNTKFIEEIVAKHAEGANCIYADNL